MRLPSDMSVVVPPFLGEMRLVCLDGSMYLSLSCSMCDHLPEINGCLSLPEKHLEPVCLICLVFVASFAVSACH